MLCFSGFELNSRWVPLSISPRVMLCGKMVPRAVVDPLEQVIVADVVKECCWVAVGHDGFVDLFIWCQSHHIIVYVVPGHVDVPHVLILLLG